MDFQLSTTYKPQGDQPRAIGELISGINAGEKDQVLLGVTGSGKTFTMAKVIEDLQRPALILAHNKTLAAQLYHEFKTFFPNNAVEYFVSYYDYYQPEAYIPAGTRAASVVAMSVVSSVAISGLSIGTSSQVDYSQVS